MVEALTFSALGEPTRLRIVELLRDGALPVGAIAERLAIRQPQASKHLRVLADAGIVAGRREARRRLYGLEPAPFEALGHWVDSFERLWDARLDALGHLLDVLDPPTHDRTDAERSPDGQDDR